MNYRLTTVERAYQLAESGEFANVGEIKRRLSTEGYSDVQGQLYGSTITSALKKLCDKARAGMPAEPVEKVEKDADAV